MPDAIASADIVTGPTWISPYPRPPDRRPVMERRPKTAGGSMREMRFAATASSADATTLMSNLRKCLEDCGLPGALMQPDPYGIRPVIGDFTDWEMAPLEGATPDDITDGSGAGRGPRVRQGGNQHDSRAPLRPGGIPNPYRPHGSAGGIGRVHRPPPSTGVYGGHSRGRAPPPLEGWGALRRFGCGPGARARGGSRNCESGRAMSCTDTAWWLRTLQRLALRHLAAPGGAPRLAPSHLTSRGRRGGAGGGCGPGEGCQNAEEAPTPTPGA